MVQHCDDFVVKPKMNLAKVQNEGWSNGCVPSVGVATGERERDREREREREREKMTQYGARRLCIVQGVLRIVLTENKARSFEGC